MDDLIANLEQRIKGVILDNIARDFNAHGGHNNHNNNEDNG